MNICGERFHVQVLHRELIRVAFRRYLDIQCLEGVFWITQDGSRADIVIKAGQTAALRCPGAAAMQALASGRLCLVERE